MLGKWLVPDHTVESGAIVPFDEFFSVLFVDLMTSAFMTVPFHYPQSGMV